MKSKFVGTEEILESVRDAEPFIYVYVGENTRKKDWQ